MPTDTDTKEIRLDKPQDWDRWTHALKIQAEDRGLWDHITLRTPLLEEPVPPEIDDIHIPNSRPARGRSSTRASAASTRTQSRNAGESSGSHTPTANEPSELDIARENQIYFGMAIQSYQVKEKLYTKQQTGLLAIKSWFEKTVAAHHYQVACQAGKPIWQWYQNLEDQAGMDESEAKEIARKEYRAALKPLIRPRDWTSWLETWQKAMTRAENRGIIEATTPDAFVPEFLQAVQPVAENWASTYKQITDRSNSIDNISRSSLTSAFRKEMMSRLDIIPRRVGKGAFGVTFGDEESPDQTKGRDRRRPTPPPTMRKRERAATDIRDPCETCGLKHGLAHCFYVFPERAPAWFKGIPEIQARVDQRLETDSALKAKVRGLQLKKSKGSFCNEQELIYYWPVPSEELVYP